MASGHGIFPLDPLAWINKKENFTRSLKWINFSLSSTGRSFGILSAFWSAIERTFSSGESGRESPEDVAGRILEGNWKKLGSRDSWEQAHYRPGVMMIIKEYEMAQEHMKNPNRKAKEKRSSRVTKPVATSRNYERRARQKRNKGCENDAKWNLIKVEGKWPTVLSWNNKREWIWLRVSFISLVSGCSQ